MGKLIRESSIRVRMGKKFLIENIYLYTVETGLFFSLCVGNIMLARKKQNIDPMWKVLIKQVHFPDHDYMGYTQRQCENK